MTEQFVEQGFLRLGRAFSRDLAKRAREILWKDTGCDPADRSTWAKPVVWLGEHRSIDFTEVIILLPEVNEVISRKTPWTERGMA